MNPFDFGGAVSLTGPLAPWALPVGIGLAVLALVIVVRRLRRGGAVSHQEDGDSPTPSHTFASTLLEAGVPAREVARRSGIPVDLLPFVLLRRRYPSTGGGSRGVESR